MKKQKDELMDAVIKLIIRARAANTQIHNTRLMLIGLHTAFLKKNTMDSEQYYFHLLKESHKTLDNVMREYNTINQ